MKKTYDRPLICILVTIVTLMGGDAQSHRLRPDQDDLLNLDSARAYMLELINRDRATKGLRAVAMDPIATVAGQGHSDEMAAHCFLSHLNLDGKGPDQRYTEAGGRDWNLENVFLAASDSARNTEFPLEPVVNSRYRKKELESIQAAYFNQVPPYDAHRRNILGPHHTHVGIGLSRAGGSNRQTLANAQEFVSRHLSMEAIPMSADVGDFVTVMGRVSGEVSFHSVEVARGEVPVPRNRVSIDGISSYATLRAFAVYHPDNLESENRAQIGSNGSFTAKIHLSDRDKPGVYYVRVRVKDRNGTRFFASQRVMLVRIGAGR